MLFKVKSFNAQDSKSEFPQHIFLSVLFICNYHNHIIPLEESLSPHSLQFLLACGCYIQARNYTQLNISMLI